MTVRGKPKEKAASECAIGAAIARGGGTVQRYRAKPLLVQLRLDPQDIARIDAARSGRLVAPSRHAWLLEAILEKLQREETA